LQATLLAVSIAIILALVAALVGPHFVDWTQYRATFEREATRLAGQPVRIGGAIDVSLLPTPSVTLGRVEFGSAAQPQARVQEIYAELALGPLMRGMVRASELRITGPEVSLGLSPSGNIEVPPIRVGFDPEQFVIEKVAVENARVVLADRASGANLGLERLWFRGELRSLIGPAKGEGGFTAAGERYGYRLAVSKVGDDGIKVRLGLDPSDRPLAIEADGTLKLEENSPRFDGTLTISRLAAAAGASGRGNVVVPWRASAKVKAAPDRALFEQLEYIYGPEDRALKLTGTAELRFGRAPRFESVLSAPQADLDRALALPETSSRLPLAALKAFIEPLASSYRPPFPVRLGIGVDAVTLGSGTLQSVRGDITLDNEGWDIETLEFRAPGFAQVRLSGRVAAAPQGVSFRGPAQIEASDPRSFLGWLEGRADAVPRQAGLLRASGELTVGVQQFAVDRLKFEFDRKTIEGRIAYAADGARPRLDADLKAGELDVDGVLAFARSAFEGSAFARPRDVALTVDIGRAVLAGVDIKGISGTFKLDPAGITFDHVRVADLADAAFKLNGRMEGALEVPRGTVTFDVDARGLDGTVAVLSRYWPEAAEPLRHAASRIVPLKAHATLGIEPVSSTDPGGNSRVKLALEGNAGALRMKFGADASGDIGALALPDFRLDANLTASDGGALVGLLGFDRAVNVDKRAGSLIVAVRSAPGADARIEARLNAGGLAASANGTARLFSTSGIASALDVTLQAADASPLRRGSIAQNALLPLALRAKLNASASELAIDNLSGVVGGAPLRGKLKLGLDTPRRIEGQIDTDALDVPGVLAIAAGMPRVTMRAGAPMWAGEPFGESPLADASGRIAFTASRAALTPALAARQLRGELRIEPGEVSFENVEGVLAGGRASGRLAFRRGTDGLAMRMHVALVGADAAALLPAEGRAPVSGRVGFAADLEGSGLSPASLIGSLQGAGLLTLEDAQIANLDPKAFNAAIRVAEQSSAVDAARIRDVVATVLEGGALAVPRLDAAVAINAGQASIGHTAVLGQGADLTVAGSADLADASVDGRLTLTGPVISEGANSIRPEILVTLKGPYAAVKRSIDVSVLSAWLLLRSVERQSKQISAIEAERRDLERREAERREAEKHEAEKLEAEKQEAERRDAEKREAERKALEAKASPSATPTALPVPHIMEGPSPPRASRPQRPRQPAAEQAPALPPPLNIGPPPGARPGQPPRQGNAAAQNPPPPPQARSPFETLFGVQR
jgi:large subunit ribosomal protein L24